jgi:hypothetical protein
MKMLALYKPKDINLPTLLELLDHLNGAGIAEKDIEAYMQAPAT